MKHLLFIAISLLLMISCNVPKKVSKVIDKDADEVITQIVEKKPEAVLEKLITERNDLFTKDSITITVKDTITQKDTVYIKESSDSASFKRLSGEDEQFILENEDFITTVEISELTNSDGQKIDFVNIKTTCKGKTIIRNMDFYLDFPVNIEFDKPKPIVIYKIPLWIKWTFGISILVLIVIVIATFKSVMEWINSIAKR